MPGHKKSPLRMTKIPILLQIGILRKMQLLSNIRMQKTCKLFIELGPKCSTPLLEKFNRVHKVMQKGPSTPGEKIPPEFKDPAFRRDQMFLLINLEDRLIDHKQLAIHSMMTSKAQRKPEEQ